MIDTSYADQLFESAEELLGGGLLIALFDKRVLMPLEALPRMVQNETGEALDSDRIAGMAKAGWFSILSSEVTGTAAGFPFSIPSRLGLFLKLERQGLSSAELSAFAEEEEQLIDVVLVNDEMPDEHDDDIAIVITSRREDLEIARANHARLRAAQESAQPRWLKLTDDLTTPEGLEARIDDLAAHISQWERDLEVLTRFQERGISALKPETQKRLRRDALKVRMLHETT